MNKINKDGKQDIEEHRLLLRKLTLEDYEGVKAIMDIVYPSMDGGWDYEMYASQLNIFPDGQICIEDKGRVVAVAQSIMITFKKLRDNHNYDQITGNGYFVSHDPKGDMLYGVDLFIHPDYRNLRLGRRLYDYRKSFCEEKNLRGIIVGGRMPGYQKHARKMSILEYAEQVKKAQIYDPVLSFQLNNDFHIKKLIKNYNSEDKESHTYATLLEWINIYYEEEKESTTNILEQKKSKVRIGAVQWQMRKMNSVDDLMSQVEFFVDAVAGYNSDFCIFPEFFNGPLMAESNDQSPRAAIRHLAEYTDEIRDSIQRLAVSYNVNIITGSMPQVRDEQIYNISYLCMRDGTTKSQEKLHITPDEQAYWGLTGGSRLDIFETDVGKVGLLICYDVEFPELSRILADKGLQILFVPYWTDTKNAYLRVRRCAQARAIENECYVVITGNVGNLPRVENMDIQYSQAAVFSPADFAFPHDAIIAEATPNTEMTLISDLDLDLLKTIHFQGSVRNTLDRRLDLYRVDWIKRD